jgi:hypothetical protein
VGFEDETWGSRVAPPALQAWTPAPQPLRVVEQPGPPTAPDPKARACSGLLVQEQPTPGPSSAPGWLRFVADRPVSAATVAFLTWVCPKLTAWGKTALLLVGDKAAWPRSQAVRQWIRAHNQQVNREGQGSRIVRCPLPIKSPCLNPLEAHGVHGNRAVVEPTGLLTATELTERVYAYFGCPHQEPLSIPQEVS